jgi:MinD superfamily P-loop ATPase
LDRYVLATAEPFCVSALVCINKADKYPEGVVEIEAFCEQKGLPVAFVPIV